jgi:hypothetical protein
MITCRTYANRCGNLTVDRMIGIAISQAAFDAIASTLALGSVNFENATNERGERHIWLEAPMAHLLFPPSATVLCSARRG